MDDLQNKVILVTGATSGLGKAAAMLLAEKGARVTLTGRRQENGEAAIKDIEAAGGEALFIQGDVTKRDDVAAMVSKTVERFGRLDGAVNNAGISGPANIPAADIPEEDWLDVINTNLNAVWMCMKYEVPAMLGEGGEAGGGAIVNISSIYGLKGSDMGHAGYAAAKFGVVGLTKSAAIDYGDKGIRTNALCPGYSHSEMIDPFAEAMPEAIATIVQRHSSMNRLGKEAEIANAIAWLLSSSSSFVNGAAIPIDGGETTRLY